MRSSDNLLNMLRGASPSDFLPNIDVFSARLRESLDTSCSSTAVGSILEGLFFFSLLQLKVVLEEPRVEDIRLQWLGDAISQQVPSLMLTAQVVYHPYLHLPACLVHELDMLVFALTLQRLQVSLGDQVAHATWSFADTQDSSGPTQYVPLWGTQPERNTDQKLDM